MNLVAFSALLEPTATTECLIECSSRVAGSIRRSVEKDWEMPGGSIKKTSQLGSIALTHAIDDETIRRGEEGSPPPVAMMPQRMVLAVLEVSVMVRIKGGEVEERLMVVGYRKARSLSLGEFISPRDYAGAQTTRGQFGSTGPCADVEIWTSGPESRRLFRRGVLISILRSSSQWPCGIRGR